MVYEAVCVGSFDKRQPYIRQIPLWAIPKVLHARQNSSAFGAYEVKPFGMVLVHQGTERSVCIIEYRTYYGVVALVMRKSDKQPWKYFLDWS